MVVSVDRFLMAVPLLLLHLPFLLLFSLIFCGKKKKKSNEEASPGPVNISTASKRSNEPLKEAPPPVSTSTSDGNPSASKASPVPVNISTASKAPEEANKPEKSNESQKKAPPSANSKNKKRRPRAPGEPRTSTRDCAHLTRPHSPSPRSIIDEEMQQCPSEERQIKLAKIIVDIHKGFSLPYDLEHLTREQKRASVPSDYYAEVNHDVMHKEYSLVTIAYTRHMKKCTNPKKKKTEDEQCLVCKEYYEFLAMLYDKYNDSKSMTTNMKRNVAGLLYDYKGKLPNFLENTEWMKRREQLKKEMGNLKLGPPPAGSNEEQLKDCATKISEIKTGVNYWEGPDDEFRQRMAEDFEKARKIYKSHYCRFIASWRRGCPICREYMHDSWAGRLYKEAVENEKRFPDGMKKKLEEDFYIQEQNFDRYLPKYLGNSNWIFEKEWITRQREEEKRQKEKMGRK